MERNDYYCPVCDGCGHEMCCSPLICQQSPEGTECRTYLKDLKFGYDSFMRLYEYLWSNHPDLKEELENFHKIQLDKWYTNSSKTNKD